MRWPWVCVWHLDYWRDLARDGSRRNQKLRARVRELQDRTVAAEAQADVLRHELQLSQAERAAAQLKLLQASYGINPFAELQGNSVLPPEPEPPPMAATLGPHASAEEVQAVFTREGLELYGGDLRKLSRHVEMRQAEYYAGRQAPNPLDTPAAKAALKVHADLMQSIEAGRRAAQEN